ncbi:cbb3-type cytochrome c oxidase subunit I, partial [Proteus terrae]|uniref:cbb3-type cytochrome c oxidase subunit I n=1 Tax=Proteus terrae TaxID=1574161 RepID=UPI003316318A
FGIATMIIAIPTGVKIFNWLFTMYQGRIEYKSPMLWTIGFLMAFMPLYILGFMGMTRRISQNINPEFHPMLMVAAGGAALIA